MTPRLRLLGGFSVAGPEGPLTGRVTQRRQIALLTLLATAPGGTLRRDRVVAWLWPESSEERGRHSLSDTLYVLREELGEDAIEVLGDDLRLNPSGVTVDAWDFRAALESGDPDRAVDLYHGPFLDGVHLKVSDEFERWIADERAGFEQRAGEAALESAEGLRSAGDLVGAERRARRALTIDPLGESALRCLVRILDERGDRSGAVRAYEAFARRLASELEVEPAPETEALAARVRAREGANGAGEEVGHRAPVGATPTPDDGESGPSTRRRGWMMAIGLGVAGIAGAFWILSVPRTGAELTPEETLAADADPGIAVLPFRVNDPALDTWREGMVHLLSVNLDGVPELRAIDSRTLLARWGEAVPDTARPDLTTSLLVARRTGARYALVGTVVAVGPDLRLSAELYEARGGTRLGSVQVAGAPDSMLVLVNRLTIEVLRALPREGSILSDVDLATVTTNSLDALKDFLGGEALYRRGDFDGAVAAFGLAIAADTTFALAWARQRDSCNWGSVSELCGRNPPGSREEHLNRLPPRRADFARTVAGHGAGERMEALWGLVRRYPDDAYLWYQLGDGYWHYGDDALMDRAPGVRALERAIALAPNTSAEPYIHLIEHAFANADSARAARLLEAYGRITQEAGFSYPGYRLGFALVLGDPATRARAQAALDTVPTPTLVEALFHLGDPRLFEVTDESLRVLLARPDYRESWGHAFSILYRRGKLRAGLDVMNGPIIRPAHRAARIHRLYQVGMEIPPEELERVLAAAAADSTPGSLVRFSTFLWMGAYAVDRGDWEEYSAALDRQRARARAYRSRGDSLNARNQQGQVGALEGYALWKRGRNSEAIRALETAQRQIVGGVGAQAFPPNVTVRWWLGELLLEVGRPRDAERYFKSLPGDPFAALRLGKVYEELGDFQQARESYEYALLSWQDADPELQPRVREARQALARLPRSIRRE